MPELTLDLAGVKSIQLPPKVARRQERCDACYWSEKAPGGVLECHGTTPTLNLLVEPAPTLPGEMVRPGMPVKQMLRPICMWPQVPVNGFCRHWEARAEVPIEPATPA